jgi:hypothetical protein
MSLLGCLGFRLMDCCSGVFASKSEKMGDRVNGEHTLCIPEDETHVAGTSGAKVVRIDWAPCAIIDIVRVSTREGERVAYFELGFK